MGTRARAGARYGRLRPVLRTLTAHRGRSPRPRLEDVVDNEPAEITAGAARGQSAVYDEPLPRRRFIDIANVRRRAPETRARPQRV